MQPNNPFQPRPAPQPMPQPAPQPVSQPTSPQQPLRTEPPAHHPAQQLKQPVLESPILSPTHFDPKPLPANVPQGGVKPQNLGRKLSAVTILLGVVAAIAIIISIVTLVNNSATNAKLEKTTKELSDKTAIVEKVAEDTGLKITTKDDVPEYAPVSGYIYISEWGIKIKIPAEIRQLSYILDQKYRPEICFNGLEASVTNTYPAFADIDRNPGGMGCLMRVAGAEGDADESGYSFGELAYSYNDYNYFYRAPSGNYAEDEGERQLEQTAVQIIKNMLMNNISNYN